MKKNDDNDCNSKTKILNKMEHSNKRMKRKQK